MYPPISVYYIIIIYHTKTGTYSENNLSEKAKLIKCIIIFNYRFSTITLYKLKNFLKLLKRLKIIK